MSKISAHILKLISLYTTKEISETEFNDLQKWLDEAPANKVLFKDILLLYKKSRQIAFADHIDKDKAWTKIVSRLENPLVQVVKEEPKVISIRNRWFKYAAAAVVVGILATTYVFRNNLSTTTPIEVTPAIVTTAIEPGTDKATLTLEDGSVVVLKSGNSFHTHNATSNGKNIVYKGAQQEQTKIAYNYLTIPRGGQFSIKLSDGTQVWLNSESQLKFPVAFVEGELRQVELVYGEAYFDVSPSTAHKGAKFQVLNKSQEVEVVGTEFNIKAYKDETNVYTTLVEGKVDVTAENSKQRLIPNQQSNLNLKSKTLVVNTVDVYNEISWKEGVFSFKRKSLEDIMKVLSRWYDLDVEFANPELKKSGFNGTIGKDQKIEEVLETIKGFGIIKDYKITGKTVILK
ncbi:FecR family protein [Flavobacterium sp. WC2509]|uniref:FecR family protein n=1 Tax=Flavobacterium sp. WC2509 TaxID=3461406 RepID=UPI0040445AFC